MLTHLEIFGTNTTAPLLPLGDSTPSQDPIQIKDIQGLGPVKAIVRTTGYAAFDGEFYSGSNIGKRNIVLTLGLNPNWVTQSIADLRALLYQYVMPQQAVTLRFHSTHLTDVQISGFVESMEPNIFSKEPEIQVSIICPTPNFVAVVPSTVFGQIKNGSNPRSPVDFVNVGTLPSGFKLQVYTNSVDDTGLTPFGGNIAVYNTSSLGSDFLAITGLARVELGAFFEINTNRGQKYMHNVSSGGAVVSNVLRGMDPTSNWFNLPPGPNSFTVRAGGTGPIDPGYVSNMNWILTYYPQFGGL